MVTGPQQQRLDAALSGASSEAVYAASTEWHRCAQLLSTVSRALEQASLTGRSLGGETGPAVSAAFAATSEGMRGKTKELSRGGEALASAGNALVAATVGESDMNRYHPQKPHPGPYVPPVDNTDVTARGTYEGDLNDYQSSFDTRENIARRLADRIDRDFEASTEVMKSIHGETGGDDDDHRDDGTTGPQPISAGPPTGSRPPAPTGHPTTSVVGEPVRNPDHHTGHPDLPEHTTPPDYDVPVHQVTPPTAFPPPDHGTGLPPTGSTGVIGSPGSGGVSVPIAGGLGAVAAGGLASAAIGGIRGGLVPTGSVPGAAGRPIGSTSRAGGPGALGRGGTAAGTGSPTTRPGGRGGGGRGRLGGARGAASAGGGAGGRRGAAGAGGGVAGRRGGRKDQDEQGRDRDLFDDGQEWIDDADAAPGVID